MGEWYNEVNPSVGVGQGSARAKSGSSQPSQGSSGGAFSDGTAATQFGSGSTEYGSSGSTGAGSDGRDWPQSLREFVSTSFVRAGGLSDEEKVVFNRQLQELMEKALRSGKIWENDWQKQKIPILDAGCGSVELESVSNGEGVKVKSKKNRIKSMASSLAKGSVGTVTTANIPAKPVFSMDTDGNKRGGSDEFNSLERKKQRMARFGQESLSNSASGPLYLPPQNGKFNQPVVGRCKDLEKTYLRLTSEPDPARVRPQKVLQKSLQFVLERYRSEPSLGYSYVNNQFKSIRQDLTVQHIKSDFAIEVYETHARIAITNNDLGEFNQCQSQLKYFYHLKKKSENRHAGFFYAQELEFMCYRIVYMLMMDNHSEINKLRLELFSLKGDTKQKKDKVKQDYFEYLDLCLLFQNQMITGDYHNFFKTYHFFHANSTLHLIHHMLKNLLVEKERLKALKVITAAYKRVPVSLVMEELRFGEDKESCWHEWDEFIKKHKLEQVIVNGDFDCTLARSLIISILSRINFKKVDIKGQV